MLRINADYFLPLCLDSIPTGEFEPVEGSPFDFRKAKNVGEDIDDESKQLKVGKGYDHCFILNRENNIYSEIAYLAHKESGREMRVFSTQPGIQLYTGNHLDGVEGKDGFIYRKNSALCLETQHFPDSPNQPSFPSTFLKEGEKFESETIYRFS